MKTLILLLTFLSLNAQGEDSPCNTLQEQLNGSWQYSKYSYQGETRPRPNPRLQLFLEFYETGTNRVWWKRTNEQGFCERVGQFRYDEENCTFTDTIVWVNPANNAECGADPDMQQGRTATSPLQVIDGELHMYFQLKGEPFIYIFENLRTTDN